MKWAGSPKGLLTASRSSFALVKLVDSPSCCHKLSEGHSRRSRKPRRAAYLLTTPAARERPRSSTAARRHVWCVQRAHGAPASRGVSSGPQFPVTPGPADRTALPPMSAAFTSARAAAGRPAAAAASGGGRRRRQGTSQPLPPAPAVAVDRERELSSPPSTSGRLGGGSALMPGRRNPFVDASIAIRAARFAQHINEQMWHERLAGDLLQGGRWAGLGVASMHWKSCA